MLLLLVVAVLLAALAPDALAQGGLGGGSGDPCRGLAHCERVLDANDDGDLADDLQTAANRLLDPNQAGGLPAEVYFGAPPPGTYTLAHRVRFCLSTGTTAGSAEPTCDAVGQTGLPILRGVGDWALAKLVPGPPFDPENRPPYAWEPSASGPDAALWFGDLWNDQAGYVRVDWPGLYPDGWVMSFLDVVGAWNRIAPILCDGCEGRIGWRSTMSSDGDNTTVQAGAYFVGQNLRVSLDLVPPPGASLEASGDPAVATLIGDGMTVGGYVGTGALSFGREAQGLFGAAATGNTYGNAGGVVYVGTYEMEPGSVVDGGTLSGISAMDAAAVTYRGRITSQTTTKPTVQMNQNAGTKGGIHTFDGVDLHSPPSINPPIRVTAGSQFDRNYPIRVDLGGVFRNDVAADNGPLFSCLSQQPRPVACIVNIGRTRRDGKGPIVLSAPGGGGGGRYDDTAHVAVESPASVWRTAVIPAATAASGKCILNLLSGAPTVGTCDATAEVGFDAATVIGHTRLKLLADSVGGSSCLVAMQQTAYPTGVGASTWHNGPISQAECIANDDPHPGCSAAGVGAGLRGQQGAAWLELHYGEAAAGRRQVSVDNAGESYFVNQTTRIWPGGKVRFQFQQVRKCAAGGNRPNWECASDSDCGTSTPCATVASCGDTNPFELVWQEFPDVPEPQCYDGLDNDGDGTADWATSGGDAGCASRTDDDESA
ncbi:MAG: hypothetical protein DCC71_02885 [Proteobacteria bacterium]|nr:MAG: hypothetical protein DCC71_02885 [Pseudomonadota bacterium]